MMDTIFAIAAIASFTAWFIVFLRGLWSYILVVAHQDTKFDAAWAAIGFVALNILCFMARKWIFGTHRGAISNAEEWYWICSMAFAVTTAFVIARVFNRLFKSDV